MGLPDSGMPKFALPTQAVLARYSTSKEGITPMHAILNDFSTQTLTRAIKANWMEYYLFLGRATGAELHIDPHLKWLLTGLPDAFNNVVLETRLPLDGAGELIDQAISHFRSRSVRRLSWWTEASAQKAQLEKLLLAHGLVFNEGGTGMAADLMALPANLPTAADLTVVPVENEEKLKQWAHIVTIGFGLPAWSETIWSALFADLVFEFPLRNYLAILNGQPVGASQLFLGAGVAGIYNVASLPEARGQGVGTAVTLAPLLEARALGFRISILQASHLGYNVYRRLGFQDFGKLNHYQWENEREQPEMGVNPT
jgi:GNAT superfamily N-acetyltransferase